ncbi:alanine racemase [Macrococcus carouselicus]|uniref:Alanine racemase n=1 Tax=Macrococcus carouselicus TaxID=69969 RepID=A0A9Q8CG95_9STAP|nr:alanine racemase [Macrococcus carouselicus]TDL95364.1 alanine racemase [Macrococcus carouselicus]
MNYYRQSVLNINLDDLYHNYLAVDDLHPAKKTIAVIKANAYGTGAVTVARHLSENGVDFFAVATLDEALELRSNDIEGDILILGIVEPEDIREAAQQDIAVTLPGALWLEKVLRVLGDVPLKVHIKIDTGMNRIGIRSDDEYSHVLASLAQHDNLLFEGVYTHFSCADMPGDSAETAHQRFMTIVNAHDKPKYIHSQNTAAALRYEMNACTALRLGIGLYGYYPSEFISHLTEVALKPIMQLVSEVNFVKDITAGTTIGYGANYEAVQNERIATLPIGYADGLLRSMSGYHVRVNGKDAEIVGRVCMDQTMIRVPADVNVGDKVIIIDNQPGNQQSMEVAERQQQTISYEVLCNLGMRLPRVYRTEQKYMVKNTLLK